MDATHCVDAVVSSRMNYAQRLFGTAVGFVSFGLGGLTFALLIFPWLRLRHPQPAPRARALRKAISRSFRLHTNLLNSLGVLNATLHHPERLQRGQLIVANHPSLLDIVFLVGFVENAVCVVKDGLFHNFWMGFAIRMAGYVSNKDPEQMIIACQAALDKGASVIIFPEGTRSVPGERHPLQRGAAYIALAARRQIVPVKISCLPSTLRKAQPWYDIPPVKVCYDFLVGEPVDISANYELPRTVAARNVNKQLEQLLFAQVPNQELHSQTHATTTQL